MTGLLVFGKKKKMNDSSNQTETETSLLAERNHRKTCNSVSQFAEHTSEQEESLGPYVPLIYNLIVCITVIKTRKLTKIASCSKVKVKTLLPNPHFLGVCRAVTAVSSSLWTFVSAL